MKHPKRITHRGTKYYINALGKYYQGKKSAGETLLHRVVWSEHHGKIAPGMCVHHKNGDGLDNRIENLELMEHRKHCSHHMKERWALPSFRRRIIPSMAAGSKRFSNSPEGKLLRRKISLDAWKRKRKKSILLACKQCGESFFSYMPFTKWCSVKCTNAFHYARCKTAKRKCLICGKSFASNKYTHSEHCSRKCRAVTIWKTRRSK